MSLLKRLGLLVLALLILAFVVRAIVTPLARQRQERRELDPHIFSLLPASSEAWVLKRGFHRQAPGTLWAGGRGILDRRLAEWGLPLEAIMAELSLLRLFGGEWLGALCPDDEWLLVGPLSQLPRHGRLARALGARPDTLLVLEPGTLSARGRFFALASTPELLDEASWLDDLPDWLELTDLMVAGDWLEFRDCGEGGALVGAKWMLDVLLCEGLAWGCAEDAPRLLRSLAPEIPAFAEARAPAADELEFLPGLRASPPFGPDGKPLLPDGSAYFETSGLVGGERLWRRDDLSALARSVHKP
jgi:hypothetical protein